MAGATDVGRVESGDHELRDALFSMQRMLDREIANRLNGRKKNAPVIYDRIRILRCFQKK